MKPNENLAPRVLLLAGHWAGDPGAISRGVQENELTKELAEGLFQSLNYSVTVLMDDFNKPLPEVIAWVRRNTGPKTIVLDLHFNAGGGSGTEAIIRTLTPDDGDRFTNESYLFASRVAKMVSDTLEIPLRKRGTGGVMAQSETPRGRLALFQGAVIPEDYYTRKLLPAEALALQARINRHAGRQVIAQDGVIGPKTEAAVREYAQIPGIVALLEVCFIDSQTDMQAYAREKKSLIAGLSILIERALEEFSTKGTLEDF